MKKYIIDGSSQKIKTFVAVKTFGKAITVVTIHKTGIKEIEIAKSIGKLDGEKYDFNGDIPLTDVRKNKELNDYFINFYIDVDIKHLAPDIKKLVKPSLLKDGVIIGLKGGPTDDILYGLEEEDFDIEIEPNIISIVKTIKFV